eukprot:726985-Alexandrium_andersonii.AAC.1
MDARSASLLSTCPAAPPRPTCKTSMGCRAGMSRGLSLATSMWTSASRATSARSRLRTPSK